ncbi:MAG: hypothetical protein KF699_11155 [Phycisphaeraceae bacterium]|nr:hypothetical protein [Phycisphaeraceae bacterium]
MSRTIARLLLSMLLMPFLAVLYIIGMVAIREWLGVWSAAPFALAGITCALAATSAWWLIWRGAVQWTTQRGRRTTLATVLWVVAGLAIGVVIEMAWTSGEGFGSFVGASAGILGWMMTTVFIWRETAAERAARLAALGIGAVACPACGYNLTGLKTTTCPECGGSFSIQELAASARGAGELET